MGCGHTLGSVCHWNILEASSQRVHWKQINSGGYQICYSSTSLGSFGYILLFKVTG